MEPTTVKTTTTTIDHSKPPRRAAVSGLAVVGFIALIFIGITIAIYAARYVPQSIARLGSANVYFSSLFGGGEEDAELEVVPGNTVSFEDEENDEVAIPFEPVATSTPTTPPTPAPVTPPAPRPYTPGPVTTRVIQVPAPKPELYGRADLTVRVLEVGYLRSASTDSFVASREVPEGKRPAVRFRVTNAGTNKTGSWKFTAKLPTTSSYTFESRSQASLNPKQFVDFTLGYDRPKTGENEIRITIDSDDDVSESNERNNTLTIEVDVERD